MFFMFHHIPKCGGTSFNAFLGSVFRLHLDYHNPGGPARDQKKFRRYLQNPLDLGSYSYRDCVAGHYNLDSIFLWQRYPRLDELEHRKFSILRDPFDAALSGVYFNIKRGVATPDPSPEDLERRVLQRAGYFARVFGIEDEGRIEQVLERYWFVAPLDRIADAAQIIQVATGRNGLSVGRANVTKRPADLPPSGLEMEFRGRAALDYAIFDRVCSRFEDFIRDGATA